MEETQKGERTRRRNTSDQRGAACLSATSAVGARGLTTLAHWAPVETPSFLLPRDMPACTPCCPYRSSCL